MLDKENAAARKGIFMIDASKGFMKDGNKNRLREQDIHKIVDVFNNQIELPKYSRMVSLAEIEANDFNLNIPRYIDSTEPEDLQDIAAHLLGGIPNRDIDDLARYWDLFPGLKEPAVCRQLPARLQRAAGAGGRDQARRSSAILSSWHTRSWSAASSAGWQADVRPRLKGLAVGCRPKQVIEEVSEALLKAFADVWLLDKYDLYQRLMTYWAETMQDDVYLIAADGWQASGDLVPAPLVIARYFAAEQEAIVALEAEREAIGRQMEELDEEHGGEGGLLEEAKNEKGKLTKAALKARVREIFDDPEAADELAVVNRYLALIDQEAEASKRVREAQRALDAKVAAKYKALSEDEIKTLVVDDKWLATLAADVQTELDRVSQALTGRIKELAERYAAPLPATCRGRGNPVGPRGRAPGKDGVRMEVRPGYKQTEVGVIPEDWDDTYLVTHLQTIDRLHIDDRWRDNRPSIGCSVTSNILVSVVLRLSTTTAICSSEVVLQACRSKESNVW